MPQSCVAYNCYVRHQKGGNVKFHSFPKSEILRDQWIAAVRRADFVPSVYSRICSNHFNEDDYDMDKQGKKVLKKNAIPSKFSFDNFTPSKAETSDSNILAVCNLKPTPIVESMITDSSNLVSTITQPQPESSSTSTEPLPCNQMGKRKRSVPVYVGDFIEADLENPLKRHKYWNVSQTLISNLRKSNKKYRSLVCKYKKKIETINELLDDLKKRFQISSESSIVLKECIPVAEKQLLERQLKGKFGKFPPELRTFALTLNFYSSSAYNFIRNTYGKNCLPHPNTLMKWCSSVDGSPGYTSEAIKAVKIKVEIEKSKGNQLIAGLIMDEMSIKEHVEWKGSRQVGYINYGTGIHDNDALPKAKNALVFMLVALNAKWKVPIAYFLVDKLTAEEKANLVKGCLVQMESTGILIKSLTFDGAPSNISMCTILGANLEWPDIRPYFLHPKTHEKIHVILDACHMVKLCRNTLGDWGYFYNEEHEEINWQYFVELVKIQNESGLHMATKIRNRHLNYEKEKMRVKLAVEMFSASVADAIEYCDKDLNILQFNGSEALVGYCRQMNEIFDLLNSRNFLNKIVTKKPLSLENEALIKDKIDTAIKYLSGLRDQIGNPILYSQRKTGFVGLIICLTSVRNMFDELIKTGILKFLCTYKLSQDHLEMFFSLMRSRGGFNNNPTAIQFEGAYKRVLIHTELQSSDAANCLAQDETSILNASSASVMNRNLLDSLNVEAIEVEDLDIMVPFEKMTSSMYYSDIIEYIAGFISRGMIRKINCQTCAESLTSSTSNSALLNRKNRGGLCKPSSDVIKLCMVAESIIRSMRSYSDPHIMNKMIILGLRKISINDTFTELRDHSLEQDALSDHHLQLVKLIFLNYFTVRLHHINKTSNEVDSRIRQKLTKLIHFRNQ